MVMRLQIFMVKIFLKLGLIILVNTNLFLLKKDGIYYLKLFLIESKCTEKKVYRYINEDLEKSFDDFEKVARLSFLREQF